MSAPSLSERLHAARGSFGNVIGILFGAAADTSGSAIYDEEREVELRTAIRTARQWLDQAEASLNETEKP